MLNESKKTAYCLDTSYGKFHIQSARPFPLPPFPPPFAPLDRSEIDSESSSINARLFGCFDRGRGLCPSGARNCSSLAGRLRAEGRLYVTFTDPVARACVSVLRLWKGPQDSGERSRLRFECVDALLSDGVTDLDGISGGGDGARLDRGDDARSAAHLPPASAAEYFQYLWSQDLRGQITYL